jgi:hypothetical protein
VPALDEEAEADDVTDQAPSQQAAAELVANLGCPAHEVPLLRDPAPLAGEDVKPEVMRVSAE